MGPTLTLAHSFIYVLKILFILVSRKVSKWIFILGYDVPSLAQHFDWIAVMTYDFHGHWDKQTGHVAPLYYYPGDTYDYFNANFSLHYWMEKGAPASKLIMGMPLYGQSFSLADASNRGLNSKSYGPGEAGEFTRAGGFLAFYEVSKFNSILLIVCHYFRFHRFANESKGAAGLSQETPREELDLMLTTGTSGFHMTIFQKYGERYWTIFVILTIIIYH